MGTSYAPGAVLGHVRDEEDEETQTARFHGAGSWQSGQLVVQAARRCRISPWIPTAGPREGYTRCLEEKRTFQQSKLKTADSTQPPSSTLKKECVIKRKTQTLLLTFDRVPQVLESRRPVTHTGSGVTPPPLNSSGGFLYCT